MLSPLKMIAPLVRRIVPERFRPIGYFTHLVRQRTAGRVRLGPFAGMHYVDASVGSAYLPKLLGTYERELAYLIEQACANRPGLIVDLGAAEGYYAVGLARRNPQARVIAFEQDIAGREALRKMARLNGVADQVEIHGRCEAADLQLCLNSWSARLPNHVPFVICDVEGDERLLLDLATVPSLETANVLVETHDFIRPGITEELRSRFGPTHTIECIWQSARSRREFPFSSAGTRLLPGSYLDSALSEWRPVRMCWLWMKANDH